MGRDKKVAFVTGVTGQDGSYLTELLLSKGYEVHGMVRRTSTFNRQRIEHIINDARHKDSFRLHYGDLGDSGSIARLLEHIRPDEIYNLGAQSHVRVSFDVPEYTADTIALGTLRMLEAMRKTGPKARFYQASSSEMFGAVSESPQNENTPFRPRSIYGIAKLFAHWATVNYREAYNIFAVSGILFNHECVTAQTPIIIKEHDLIDIVPIEEIVPHRESPNHGKKYSTVGGTGLEVWDGDKWSKIKTRTATWNKDGSAGNKKIKRVISRGGYYEATEDHISFLYNGKETKTGNLKRGDRLKLQSFPELQNKTVVSLEEAEFLGMMVADGYVNRVGKGRFINNDYKLRARIELLWQKVAGGHGREDKHPSGFNKGKNVFSIEFAGNPEYLRLIWEEIYTEKLLKRVPRRILNASSEVMIAFLKGYNKCDGLKGGRQKTEFKSFTTNSPVLALGLWYLTQSALALRITLHPEFRTGKVYFHLNVNSHQRGLKGAHLRRDIAEIKNVRKYDYTGWLFDLETESGTFSAGIGLTWIHNSPRRGENFVTRKITMSIAEILAGKRDKVLLGNLDAKRDWGYAPEYVEAMWKMLQQDKPDDYVVATGEAHSIKEFLEEAFGLAGIKDWKKYVGIDEKYYRPTEVNFLVGDSSKAKKNLGWEPKKRFKDLVRIMLEADCERLGVKLPK